MSFRFRHAALLWIFILLFIGVGGSRLDAEISSRPMLAAILARTPAVEVVPAGMPLKTAEFVAGQRGDSCALWGIGDSMLPLYAPGTALIVEKHDYEKLKKGMTVVYRNEEGRRVAHCIVGETRGGYLMQGVNNPREDDELLTEENFLGVVVAAYAASETDFRAVTQAKLAGRDGMRALAGNE